MKPNPYTAVLEERWELIPPEKAVKISRVEQVAPEDFERDSVIRLEPGSYIAVASLTKELHEARVAVVLAAPAAVRLALAVMEVARTDARQVAPGARVTLTPGEWDRLTLLAHEVTKAVGTEWVRVPFGPQEGSR